MSSKAISTVSGWPNIAGMRAAWIVITFGPPGVYQRICCARDRFAARGAHGRHVLEPQRPVVEVADVEQPQVVLGRLGARQRTARHALGRGVGEEDARRRRLDEDQRHRHLVQHRLQPPLLLGALRRQPFRVGPRRLGALARQRLFRLVLDDQRHVLDAARRAEQRHQRDRDGDAPPLGHVHLLQLARVVPEGRRLHGLARERPLDQPEQPLPLGDLVVQDVVFGRRLRPEQIAKRLVRQQAVAVGPIHLQPERRVREDPLQQPDRIADAGEPDAISSRRSIWPHVHRDRRVQASMPRVATGAASGRHADRASRSAAVTDGSGRQGAPRSISRCCERRSGAGPRSGSSGCAGR